MFFKAQNELYHMTYTVKTAENLFTWCGHEWYVESCNECVNGLILTRPCLFVLILFWDRPSCLTLFIINTWRVLEGVGHFMMWLEKTVRHHYYPWWRKEVAGINFMRKETNFISQLLLVGSGWIIGLGSLGNSSPALGSSHLRGWYARAIARQSGLLFIYFLCMVYLFPYSLLSFYLLPFLCRISLLSFPCASVWENTLAWGPHFL